jgi:hypothetical protein
VSRASEAPSRRGFLASFGQAATSAPTDLHFETQHATEDQGRPDLVGIDDGGSVRVLVEAKFWAGFTEHQPVHYLDYLPAFFGTPEVVGQGQGHRFVDQRGAFHPESDEAAAPEMVVGWLDVDDVA